MPEKRAYRKWLVIAAHALAWVLVFTLPELLKPDRANVPDKKDIELNKTGFEILGWIFRIVWVGFFYLHSHVLLPRFAFKRKWAKYIASVVGFIVSWVFFSWAYFKFVLEGFEHQPFSIRNTVVFSVVPTMVFMMVSTTYRLILDRVNTERRQGEKVNENLKTELSLLRSQVSPHFMFNVLNNMVALARKKSDLLEPSLIKLSQLMRYMLYETEQRVPLQKEVEYLESYIDLQKQRFGNTVQIETSFDTAGSTNEIEPMLLIPFVENAFKHGVGLVEQPHIGVVLKVKDDVLHFQVSNRYTEHSDEVKDSASGIGLPNVNRRLNLLYPSRHRLDIRSVNGTFDVDLQISLA